MATTKTVTNTSVPYYYYLYYNHCCTTIITLRWKERVLDPGFDQKDGNVVIMTSGDSAQVWKQKKKGKYSLYFLGSEVLNLPFKMMSRFRLIHAVWPGPSAKRLQIQALLRQIYVPEMVIKYA